MSSPDAPSHLTKEQEREQELLKRAYLGQGDQSNRRAATSTAGANKRNKLLFEWDVNEDTSRNELNPLYANKAPVSLGFGRGFVAGVDRREQKMNSHAFWDALAKNRDAITFEDEEVNKRREERAMRMRAKEEQTLLSNRHWSEKSLEEMEERDWRIFREDFSIAFRGLNVPRPGRNWREMAIPSKLMRAIEDAGYANPSPIQRAAIPVALKMRDVIGIAETGSGKTAAFLVPMFAYIMTLPKLDEALAKEGPYAIVMAPTRELAQQIQQEAEKFGKYTGIRAVSVVGGQSQEEQHALLREGCEVIIATPGRFADFLRRRLIVLNQCNYIVLDEADRMLDLGFEPQIKEVLNLMPSSNVRPENEDEAVENHQYRQTIMFSATMKPKIEALAKTYLRNPVQITIGDRQGKTADQVEQRVEWTTESGKKAKLGPLLNTFSEGPVIIFCNTKKTCDELAYRIETESKHSVCTLHSGRSQDVRTQALKDFKDGKYSVLVTTDVMARGIDVQGVKLVVNYEMPIGNDAIEKYTHRIGRTGRGGNRGVAVSYVTEADSEMFYDLKNLLTEAKAAIPPQLANHEAAKTDPRDPVQKGRGAVGMW